MLVLMHTGGPRTARHIKICTPEPARMDLAGNAPRNCSTVSTVALHARLVRTYHTSRARANFVAPPHPIRWLTLRGSLPHTKPLDRTTMSFTNFVNRARVVTHKTAKTLSRNSLEENQSKIQKHMNKLCSAPQELSRASGRYKSNNPGHPVVDPGPARTQGLVLARYNRTIATLAYPCQQGAVAGYQILRGRIKRTRNYLR
ncbi:hypothetical protein C8R45DRAFT_89258 [Mycena sanguinolenta]|nr:hypothetical protein C8R45DRAFT_89258 [Mycena sanguinolenta]